MRLIEPHHLAAWAGSKQAEARFPYIVKSLINATVEVDKLRMPSGDASWLPGLDGTVGNAGTTSRFVPLGSSAWEVGTTDDITAKANEDYDKRSIDKPPKDPPTGAEVVLDRKKTAFVFVTPRLWTTKEQWVAAKQAEGTWLKVVAFDGADLQDWLEEAPSVSLAFAAELGLAPEVGLQTTEQAWEDWSTMSVPPASEALAVAGREAEERELVSRLSTPPSTFTVRGVSPRDAWGFALASLRRGQATELGQNLLDRAIVADDEVVAGRLRNLKHLIIVLKQARGPISATLSAKGSHVILPEGGNAQTHRDVIELPLPTHRAFAEALVQMGVSEPQADQLTRASGRSVALFQRRAAHSRFERPGWADDADIPLLLAGMLAGAWNRQSDSDKGILCLLADQPDYSTLEMALRKFLHMDEAPLRNIAELWAVIAPADTFELIARHMTKTHLDRFKLAFRQVFGTIDPRVEKPLDQWIYEDIKGERSHSAWLRTGMAESLLLIAERGADSRCGTTESMREYADSVVHELPGLGNDWTVLASIRDQYPRLMEAAPDPFVDGLEQLIRDKPEDVRRLFAEGTGLGPDPMHTGILWGLEALAWSPSRLKRVSLVLSRLAKLDPGGSWANRPINSLRGIFLWWYPGTNATTAGRLGAIDQILREEPEVGWSLIVQQLPSILGSLGHNTARPRWHDSGDLPEESRTRRGQREYLSAIIDRVLDRVGTSAERWKPVLEAWGALGPSHRDKAFMLLTEVSHSLTDPTERAAVWNLLRDFTSKHRRFRDAKWALDDDAVAALESLLDQFAPGDVSARYRWLFDEWLPDLPTATDSYEDSEEQVRALRESAASKILDTSGWAGLLSFAMTCKLPWLVAPASKSHLSNFESATEFLFQAIDNGDTALPIVASISEEARKLHGERWTKFVVDGVASGRWTGDTAAMLFVVWPSERATWDLIAHFPDEVQLAYWRRQPPFVPDGPVEDRAYKIERFIAAGRAASLLGHVSYKGTDLPTPLLFKLFDAAIEEVRRSISDPSLGSVSLHSHELREFFEHLRERPDAEREEIARREYLALPLLGPLGARGLVLQEFMAEDAEFFVSVIADVFLPRHRDKSKPTEVDPQARARAEAGFSLLEGMDRIPGQGADGIDETRLRDWLSLARAKASEVDRAEIADQKIGQLLAHAPNDPEDSAWPHRVIRNVIEAMSTDQLEKGLLTERHNMRGVYTKQLYEGGVQERQLADEYRGWASICESHWPRTSEVLLKIAESWERMAEREDKQAEQDKLGDG